MPDKTTQILKEIKKVRKCIVAFRADMQVQLTDNTEGEIFSAVPTSIVNQWFDILEKKIIPEALSQQQQEDYQEVLDLDIMKDEGEVEYAYMDNIGTGQWITLEGDRKARNKFRAELRQAIAEKRGKV